jgi:hypothetical protein
MHLHRKQAKQEANIEEEKIKVCGLWKRGITPSAARFMLASCLAYSLTLKMEVTCFSETSVDFQRTTQRYIPEYGILHNNCCYSLKFYIHEGRLTIDPPAHQSPPSQSSSSSVSSHVHPSFCVTSFLICRSHLDLGLPLGRFPLNFMFKTLYGIHRVQESIYSGKRKAHSYK